MNAGSGSDIEQCFSLPLPPGHRRIAWDGLSFGVPSNWELAVFRFLRRGVTRIELEDEYTVRLEAEWIRSRKRMHIESIMQRYEKASKPLTLKSDERHKVDGLPQGWHATHFVFKETGRGEGRGDLSVTRHDLVTAFYLCPRSSIFCFFMLHFLPEDSEDPADTVRQLAGAFQDHSDEEARPWELFDIDFTMPREFRLEKAAFDIGTKLMVFEWRWRRFYLWHFSCPEMFLKDGVTPAEWVTGYLNGYSGLPGPRFAPDGKGGITWRRRRPFLFGHRSEIARWCFRYRIGWRLDESRSQLVAWVYHYRREKDIDHVSLSQLPDAIVANV